MGFITHDSIFFSMKQNIFKEDFVPLQRRFCPSKLKSHLKDSMYKLYDFYFPKPAKVES